ncbi:phenazine biosynthesis PhzC/PhzF family protein [Pseudohyphozyma bogoriensis]|nr:phenazine biosynthesis PhzC/PhzF family protein [Pseudohyphozyma bogoriensis]
MSAPPLTFYLVDAFTDEAFGGNPAAVILSASELDPAFRSSIAKELNQPAAAFVSHPSMFTDNAWAQPHSPSIRWHTSSGKAMAFCGHATMAASTVAFSLFPDLKELKYIYQKAVKTEGVLGIIDTPLKVEKLDDGRFLLKASAANQYEPLELAEEAKVLLQVQQGFSLRSEDIVELNKSLSKTIPFHGIWVTSTSSVASYQARTFFPSFGIDEDWVCGTANTLIAPYWFTKQPSLIRNEGGVATMEAVQVSVRGGGLGVRWDTKWGAENGVVALIGRGKIVAKGELYI